MKRVRGLISHVSGERVVLPIALPISNATLTTVQDVASKPPGPPQVLNIVEHF